MSNCNDFEWTSIYLPAPAHWLDCIVSLFFPTTRSILPLSRLLIVASHTNPDVEVSDIACIRGSAGEPKS